MLIGGGFKWTCKVCHQAIDLDTEEFLIAHGKSCFLKPEKLAKMSREHVGPGQLATSGVVARLKTEKLRHLCNIPADFLTKKMILDIEAASRISSSLNIRYGKSSHIVASRFARPMFPSAFWISEH